MIFLMSQLYRRASDSEPGRGLPDYNTDPNSGADIPLEAIPPKDDNARSPLKKFRKKRIYQLGVELPTVDMQTQDEVDAVP
jgi:hypothetical protein